MPPTPLAIPSTTAITATQYYLNGSTILTQITGDDRFDFFYDENGLLLGFSYNGAKYYYIRNQQSDIIGILDNSGNQVVSYMYDSWGKLLTIEGSAKDTIGVQNPFRYRGYYYDTETELYYLNSRYYDPGVGRFLNADKILGELGEINQSNVFAYCRNNPIHLCDANGEFATAIAGALIGIGGTNIWNPIGWIVFAVAGFSAIALAINSNVTNSQSSKRNAAARAQRLIYSASTTATPPPPNHGGRGTQTTSTTLYKNNDFRIDVENPGNRVGQIHLQKDGIKYYYNVGDRTFRIGSSSGELAPRSIQRLLEDPDVIIAIGKGLRILGY